MKLESFTELAELLQTRVAALPAAIREGALAAGEVVRDEARDMLGHYQDGWGSLSPETQARRVQLGFPADEPLLRTGALRDAIEVRPIEGGVSVGVHSDSPMLEIARAHELGFINAKTGRSVPPRPFVSLASAAKAEVVTRDIEERVVATLDGKM